MMAKMFVEVHSSANLSEEGQRGRDRMIEEHPGVLDRRKDVSDVLNAPFTMAEVKRAIGKAGLTSPGKMRCAMLCWPILVMRHWIRFWCCTTQCGRRGNYQAVGGRQ
jgi:hypothetical protein